MHVLRHNLRHYCKQPSSQGKVNANTLNRNHNLSPVTGAEVIDEAETSSPGIVKETRETSSELLERVSSWSDMWRSIILSSAGKTLYPYCLYIRVLDLRNLKELFTESVFVEKVSKSFFEGAISEILKVDKAAMNTRSKKRLDTVALLAATGESVTKYVGDAAEKNNATAALEEMTGELTAEVLPIWTARLARLKTMTLWDGNVLGEDVAQGIRDNCPHFSELSLFYCAGDEADHRLGNFISGLRPGSLQTLEIINSNDVHAQTFLALSGHRKSLKELKLASLKAPAMRSLSLLKECTALQTLNLQDAEGLMLEASENDTFLEVIAWLKACTRLRDLTIQRFVDGPAIMTAIFRDDKIRLKSFDISGYTLAGNQIFHQALANQTELESLDLRADAEESFRDDIEVLINSICSLKNLKRLNLLEISDYFSTDEVKLLAKNLSKVRIDPATEGIAHLAHLFYIFYIIFICPYSTYSRLF